MLSGADLAATRAALAAAEAGDWNRGLCRHGGDQGPAAAQDAALARLRQPGAPGRFAEIADFIEKNPDWPHQKALREHAEEALAGETDAVAADWLKRYPPISAAGQVRAAEILLECGRCRRRHRGVARGLGRRRFQRARRKALSRQARRRNSPRGRRAAARPAAVGAARSRRPGGCCRGSAGSAGHWPRRAWRSPLQAPAADDAGRPVPPQLRTDPGLLYEELRWRREKDMTDAAVAILLANPGDPVHPRHGGTSARSSRGGCWPAAIPILPIASPGSMVRSTATPMPTPMFLLGYIALRFKKGPGPRLRRFFAHPDAAPTRPYAKARAGYWGGRAAEAEAKPSLAAQMVCRRRRAHGDVLWPARGASARRRRAAASAAGAGPERRRARRVRRRRGRSRDPDLLCARRPPAQQAVSAASRRPRRRPRPSSRCSPTLAEQNGRIDLAIAVAKRAIIAGTPLMIHGYPTVALPSGGNAEHALLLRDGAAGERLRDRRGEPGRARGPDAADAGDGELDRPQGPAAVLAPRLTIDGGYNIKLGRAYLAAADRRFRRLLCAGDRRLQRRPRPRPAMARRNTAIRAAARSTWSTGSRRSRSTRRGLCPARPRKSAGLSRPGRPQLGLFAGQRPRPLSKARRRPRPRVRRGRIMRPASDRVGHSFAFVIATPGRTLSRDALLGISQNQH